MAIISTDVQITGAVTINGVTYPSGDGAPGQFLSTDGNGTLSFSSKTVLPISSSFITSSTSLNDTDYTALVDATSGSVVITLSDSVVGKVFNVKKIDSSINTVTVTPESGTIDGEASKIIASQWTNLTAQTDGTNWYIL